MHLIAFAAIRGVSGNINQKDPLIGGKSWIDLVKMISCYSCLTLPALGNFDCRNDANITSLAEILQPFAEACGEIS